MAGRPYIVGERGPELFVPSRGGMVIPNHMLPPEAPSGDMDFSDMIKFGAMMNLMRPKMPGLMYSGEHGALQSPY